MWNIAWYLAYEAVGWMGYNQGIFHKIAQDNCFIIPHIDKKSTVLLWKSWKRSLFCQFSPWHTNLLTYLSGPYIISGHKQRLLLLLLRPRISVVYKWRLSRAPWTFFWECYNVLNEKYYKLHKNKNV